MTAPSPAAICAACGAETPDGEACATCGQRVRLADRYRLLAPVGHGAAGTTYRATDLRTGAPVAVKEMPLRAAVDARARERMEREARVLGELRHPRIPQHVDHFEAGAGKQRAFYLVQGFIEGPTLAQEMARRRYTEADVLDMIDDVLDILVYLHALRPPVIHRDIKPGNLIRRGVDDRLVLIDFGSVRDVLTDPRLGGSTVAGTYGFMAPEQFRGDAVPQTDLYGVGALAVALLSRRDLLDLVGADHRLRWREHVDASPPVLDLIESLLRPEPAERPTSAEAVRATLGRIRRGEASPPRPHSPAHALVRPAAGPLLPRHARSHRRSAYVAAALAFAAGLFGVHHFYLDRRVRGVLSIAFFWTLVPLVVSLVDGVRFLRMPRSEFDREYNPAWLEAERRTQSEINEEIHRLHLLVQAGALSPEEFEQQKRRLLGERRHRIWALLEGDGLDHLLDDVERLTETPRRVIEALQGRRRHKRMRGPRGPKGR